MVLLLVFFSFQSLCIGAATRVAALQTAVCDANFIRTHCLRMLAGEASLAESLSLTVLCFVLYPGMSLSECIRSKNIHRVRL